ncbi:MAG: hypothetical protein ACR2PI_26915 [Hyphomicrobiaceae bacterium]
MPLRLWRFFQAAIACGMVCGWIAAPAAAAELIMLEEHGCEWCERWNEEVGVVYHKTPEGKRAPLRRLDIHKPLPAELKFLVKGRYTPTFVLIENGRDMGRIRGYPGEDFFWGLLGKLLERLPAPGKDNATVN